MKKFASFPVITALVLMLLGSPALAGEITVMNGCSFPITALSLSDTNSDKAEDLLGNDVLKPGEGLRINIQGGDSGWDLIAADEKGNAITFEALNLKGVSQVTLKEDGTADLR